MTVVLPVERKLLRNESKDSPSRKPKTDIREETEKVFSGVSAVELDPLNREVVG